MNCPPAEDLVRLAQGQVPAPEREALVAHAEGCEACRLEVALAVRALRGWTKVWRLRTSMASAAALLLAVSLWGILDDREQAAPVIARPSVVPGIPWMRVSAEARKPARVWLGPGSLLEVLEGSIRRSGDSRLELAQGEVRIEHRSGAPLELATPAGTVRCGGPWMGRLRCEAPPQATGWLLRSAAAASRPLLVLEVQEGRVEVCVREDVPALLVQAGERVSLSPGEAPRLERFTPPAPEGLRVWKGEALKALLGTRGLRLQGGAEGRLWTLPLPGAEAYQVELRVRPVGPTAHMGLDAPVAGTKRSWHLSRADCPEGAVHTVSLAILGAAASGSVDGRGLWTVDDALKALQPAGPLAGLRVWGEVEVLELRVRTWEKVGHGG